ncbi:hypothetical protein NKH55_33040 [Mesorhizobium opportunistum]|uniref:hypothetical protein n=1 Tax=Mesorhizobium opportunistum TaxID=593909 RepID=UPI003337837D
MEGVQKITNLMRSYRSRQCLLFVGAGFSAEASSIDLEGKAQQIPSGKILGRELINAVDGGKVTRHRLTSHYEA